MSEKIYPKIIVVDENDENPRAVTWEDAMANGWIRRAARVFVVNDAREVLIQRRSEHISKPLLLDNSAAGHVDEGEEYIDAAIRELYEELGIVATSTDLEELPRIRETSFFSRNYVLRVSSDVSITIDPEEIAEYYWKSPKEIDLLVSSNAAGCTDSLIVVWPQVRASIVL